MVKQYGILFASMYISIQNTLLKMTFSQKLFKNSFAKKHICTLANVFEYKGISTFLSNKYLVTLVNIDCKNILSIVWQSLLIKFRTVEKITQVSKALQSNVLFTWNRT